MVRAVLQSMAFFLTPFVLFALYLVARRRFPFAMEHWTRNRTGALAMAGLVLMIAGQIVLAINAPRFEGEYTPARVENGRIVPGTSR